jgi:hypothetical protein
VPTRFVEIDSEEEAGLVEEQRIDARDEALIVIVPSRQVPANDVVSDRQETTVRADRALDPWLLADPPHPFVRASGRVARLPGLPALESPRIDVVPSAEERPEERHLFGRRRVPVDRASRLVHQGLMIAATVLACNRQSSCRDVGLDGVPTAPTRQSRRPLSTTYGQIRGAKKGRLAPREPTLLSKLLILKTLKLAERVGFEPARTL